jgi:hypothetical protein
MFVCIHCLLLTNVVAIRIPTDQYNYNCLVQKLQGVR